MSKIADRTLIAAQAKIAGAQAAVSGMNADNMAAAQRGMQPPWVDVDYAFYVMAMEKLAAELLEDHSRGGH